MVSIVNRLTIYHTNEDKHKEKRSLWESQVSFIEIKDILKETEQRILKHMFVNVRAKEYSKGSSIKDDPQKCLFSHPFPLVRFCLTPHRRPHLALDIALWSGSRCSQNPILIDLIITTCSSKQKQNQQIVLSFKES